MKNSKMSKNRPISKKNLFRIKIQQNFTKLIYFHDTRRRKVAVMSTGGRNRHRFSGGRKKGKGSSRGSRTGEDISEDVDGIQENNTTAETKTTDKAHVIEGKEAATAGYELVKICRQQTTFD